MLIKPLSSQQLLSFLHENNSKYLIFIFINKTSMSHGKDSSRLIKVLVKDIDYEEADDENDAVFFIGDKFGVEIDDSLLLIIDESFNILYEK